MPSARARIPALDVLRGAAILLVLFHHPAAPPWSGGVLTPVTSAFYRVGWTGVDLFFVLSGFLVGGQLLRQQREIWPSYFAFLAIVYVELVWCEPTTSPAVALQRLLPNLLHVQNYFPVVTPRIPTWSLAVEEHFYLGLPFVLLATAWIDRHRRARTPGAAARRARRGDRLSHDAVPGRAARREPGLRHPEDPPSHPLPAVRSVARPSLRDARRLAGDAHAPSPGRGVRSGWPS